MIYRKQSGFDDFHCIADKCPKSCCEGWQIVIDTDSLRQYQAYTGDFQDRLQSGIDVREHCFRQHKQRCAMLSATGLCDLQSTLGEPYLCHTCRQYPRHVEEFMDLREYSLSLSCPEAVRMLLEPTYSFALVDAENTASDDPEEFDDFDPFLFDKLTFAREKMLRIAWQCEEPLHKRIDRIAFAALRLQDLYDQGDIFAMDDLSYDAQPTAEETAHTGCQFSYAYMMQSLSLLLRLEVLEDSWSDTLRSTIAYWQAHPATSAEWHKAMYPDTSQAMSYAKLLQALLFTYVCGSIYDGQIYARTMIAVMSVRWIMMICFANPEISLAESIYLFSREVEHSDLNINTLISAFEDEL